IGQALRPLNLLRPLAARRQPGEVRAVAAGHPEIVAGATAGTKRYAIAIGGDSAFLDTQRGRPFHALGNVVPIDFPALRGAGDSWPLQRQHVHAHVVMPLTDEGDLLTVGCRQGAIAAAAPSHAAVVGGVMGDVVRFASSARYDVKLAGERSVLP